MWIRKRPSWEIPEAHATPEALAFAPSVNRRLLLKTAGLGAFSLALAGCGETSTTNAVPAGPDPSASLYPAPRNAAFTLDRPLTAESEATSYNNYYEFGAKKDDPKRNAQNFPIRPWEISIEGMVEKPFKTDIDALMKTVTLEERLYRHRCVEAWSMAVPWTGFPLKALVDYAKPSSSARYLVMKSFMNPKEARAQAQSWYPWPYTEGLTIEEATNDLAFMVTGMYGKPLPKQNGAPLRLAVPWKYGFKSAKGIQRFIFTDQRPNTFWEALGPEEYGFWANVNPAVPHPRWSQADEEVLGSGGKRVPTLIYNGYGEQVASLYSGMTGERLFM